MYRRPVFYKYMKQEYVDAFLQEGLLRIGTLYEYRDIEKHGQHIGDDQEGLKFIEHDYGKVDWRGPHDVPEELKDTLTMEPGGQIDIRFVSRNTVGSPDYYLFCVAWEFSATVMREFGYDSCVRIDNPACFLHEINGVMWDQHAAKALFWRWCEYTLRKESHDNQTDIPPAIVKSPQFAHQKEVRAIWEPSEKEIRPLLVTCMPARQYCSRMQLH